MEGGGYYQNAENCRTSFEMIEKYQALHIKILLHAGAPSTSCGRKKKKTSDASFTKVANEYEFRLSRFLCSPSDARPAHSSG